MNKLLQARTVMGFFVCAPHPEGAGFVMSRLLQQGMNPTEVAQVLVGAACCTILVFLARNVQEG
jgi:hypothetical protein